MSAATIVVDYGIGNVFSVCNAIRRIGGTAELTGDLDAIVAWLTYKRRSAPPQKAKP